MGFVTGQVRTLRSRSSGVEGLPTGSVTFLMTDIENSTALVERLGDSYAEVRDAVQAIVRRAVAASSGREVDARADECFAVFEAAASALDAGISIQRELGVWRWSDGLACRVRIGIHTGRPKLTSSGYVGMPVNFTARISGAAHGGQILVSEDAARELDGALPAGVRLRELGWSMHDAPPHPEAAQPRSSLAPPIRAPPAEARGTEHPCPGDRTTGRAATPARPTSEGAGWGGRRHRAAGRVEKVSRDLRGGSTAPAPTSPCDVPCPRPGPSRSGSANRPRSGHRRPRAAGQTWSRSAVSGPSTRPRG